MDTSLRSRQFIIILVTVVTLTGTTFVGGAILSVEGETVSDVGDSAVTHQTDTDQAGTLVGALPLENASTKFQGVGANDTAGLAVAGAGDVNGDGKKDVLVTAPANGSAGAENGAVYLFYGPVESGDLNVTQANVTFVGSGGERAGADVALGDLNGDESAEVVIGAPRNDTNGVNAGAAYVVDGQSEYDERVELADDENVTTLFGNNARDVTGKAVTVVNRGNESGLLAVAAPRDDGAALNAGAVSLIENATTVDQRNVSEAATATIQGQYTRERAGFSVADAGDFDTDNHSELIIGAPLANVTGENAGAAYVVDTDVTGTVSVATGVQFNGSGEGDRAGWDVAEAGDFNNDSVNDVLVGAPFNDSVAGNKSGVAYVLFGEESPKDRSLTDADVTLVGENRGDLAGWSVAAAGSGDISCDNVDDIIVGAPGNNSNGVNAGAAYLVYGAPEPHPSLNLSDAGAKISGEGPGDEAGYAVAEANDSTGDGNEDILIGAPFNKSHGTEVGAAYLLDGDCPVKPEKVKTPTPTPTPETPTPKTPTPTPTPHTPTPTPKTPTPTPETPTPTPKTPTPTPTPKTPTPTPETPTPTPTPKTPTPTPKTPTPTPETPTPTPTPKTPTPTPETPTPTPTPKTPTPETPTPKTPTPTPDTPTPPTPDTPTPPTPDTPTPPTPDTPTPPTPDTPTPPTPDTPTPTATPTETPTPDDRAAISYVLLCVSEDEDVPEEAVGGAGSDACPEGTVPLVRYEGTPLTAEGPAYGTSVTATEFKDGDPTEPVAAEWVSTQYDILGAVVGAGGNVCTFTDSPDNVPPETDTGTVESCGPGGNQPNVDNQADDSGGPLGAGLLDALGLLSIVAVALVASRRW